MLKPSFFHYHHPYIFPKNLGSYEEKSYLCGKLEITLKQSNMDVAINNITTTITVPQVDFNLLKELAKKFGWVIQTEKKSGIEEALEDVKAGRVYHAKDAHDLIKQCLE